MFTKEFLEVFTQIIKSWQVIAVAVVIFLYLKIVSYVSRRYHPLKQPKTKVKKEKPAPAPAPPPDAAPEESADDSGGNDELGIEED